jgi:hypothetical protein
MQCFGGHYNINKIFLKIISKHLFPHFFVLKYRFFFYRRFTFDILSWRGVLRLIMFSLFEKHSDWLLAVIKFKNAYFLCEYVTDMQLKDEQNMTPEHRSFCYYGHKFEEYVTKSKAIPFEYYPHYCNR